MKKADVYSSPASVGGPTENRAQWIPVGERLPEPHRRVLVKGGGASFVCGWEPENGNKWTIVNDAFIPFDEVTHWMPVPPLSGQVLQQKSEPNEKGAL